MMVTFVAAHCTHIITLSFHSKVKFKPFGDSFPSFTYFSGYKYLLPFTGSLLDAQTIKDILNHPSNAPDLQSDIHDSMYKYLAK